MKNYSLPTRKECFDIIRKYHVPPHIVKHSIAAARLAVFLAQKLQEKGIKVDAELVERACLLHDVARVCELNESDYNNFPTIVTERQKAAWRRLRENYKAIGHEDIAYDLLRQKYPVLALVIKKHRYTALLDKEDKPRTWEEKIAYYADKRVMHERIVSLKERLEEAHRRNANLRQEQSRDKIDTAEVDRLISELEREIFTKIGSDPANFNSVFQDSYQNIYLK